MKQITILVVFLIYFINQFLFAKEIDWSSSHGFYRIAAVSPKIELGNPTLNANTILSLAETASENNALITIFPELSLTGYTIQDAFEMDQMLDDTTAALRRLMDKSRNLETIIIVGAPYRTDSQLLFNAAFVIHKGQILGAIPKIHLPNDGDFYEQRWFTSGAGIHQKIIDPILGEFLLSANQLFQISTFTGSTKNTLTFGVEVCEDGWATIPPSKKQALHGANVLINISASNEIIGKPEYRRNNIVLSHSAQSHAAYVYVSSGAGESTTDLVFGGHMLIGENGTLLNERAPFDFSKGPIIFSDIDVNMLNNQRLHNKTFMNQVRMEQALNPEAFTVHSVGADYVLPELNRNISQKPFMPKGKSTYQYIFDIQSFGVANMLAAAKAKSVVLLISGGADSTLAALVTVRAAEILGWSPEQVHFITMPGPGTSTRTLEIARSLAQALGVSFQELSIVQRVKDTLEDLGHNGQTEDTVFENTQARIRTMQGMNFGNKYFAPLIGTGNLDEIWLGWSTYNADQMSHYNPNASLPSTLIKKEILWYAKTRTKNPLLQKTLIQVYESKKSPELKRPNAKGEMQQITENELGPYILHEFFMFHLLRNHFDAKKVYDLAVHAFKRKYSAETIKKYLKISIERGFSQQFKRTSMPGGPQIGTVGLSPRGRWRQSNELRCNHWLEDLK